MKVLFICSGNSFEGISPIIKNQGDSIARLGSEVHYFSIRGKGLFSYLKSSRELHRYIKSNHFDLFHAHYSLSAFTASIAGCSPLVISLMGSDTHSGFIMRQMIKVFSSLKWDAVIVKSSNMKNGKGIIKALVIPNGVNLDLFRSQQIVRMGSRKKTILFAADPKRYSKNFELAEKAVLLLNRTDVELRVVYSRPQSEIIDEISNAHVLLLTSRWEGSPNIVKEAMACNCPVVATDVGDINWLFGNEPGCFIASSEPENVSEKLKSAIMFAEENNRTNGRQRIIELKLDSETIAERIINVYKSVLLK